VCIIKKTGHHNYFDFNFQNIFLCTVKNP